MISLETDRFSRAPARQAQAFAWAFLLAGVALLAVIRLVTASEPGADYGFDFHGGIWTAAQHLLSGRPVYVAPSWRIIEHAFSPFVTPPPLAVLGIPFSVLPFPVAIVLWNLLCTGAAAGALALVGVRDWRVFVVALCSAPVVTSLLSGQPDGLFALGVAVAWRYRDSWPGGLAVGALIAAKLLAWPLLIWLLVTRRVRSSLVAVASAAGMLVGSWALIGFQGMLAYPRMLAADAHAAVDSHSVAAAAIQLGASRPAADVLAVAAAVAVSLAIVRISRRSDLGWFTAAIAAGLLVSPIMWIHYLVVALVPLAIGRRRLDELWLLTALWWVSPGEPASLSGVIAVVLVALVVFLGSADVIGGRRGRVNVS